MLGWEHLNIFKLSLSFFFPTKPLPRRFRFLSLMYPSSPQGREGGREATDSNNYGSSSNDNKDLPVNSSYPSLFSFKQKVDKLKEVICPFRESFAKVDGRTGFFSLIFSLQNFFFFFFFFPLSLSFLLSFLFHTFFFSDNAVNFWAQWQSEEIQVLVSVNIIH